MRLIDADAFIEYIKETSEKLKSDKFYVDSGLTVKIILDAVIADLDGTNRDGFKRAPTIEPEPKWIPVTEALPEEGESVIVCSRYGAICIVKLVKGISEETRKKMKNGEIDNPCENLWCLSNGYTMSKRSDLYKEGDEFGNNQKDYAWKNGPYHYPGQNFIAWMPLPEPYRGDR